MNNNDDDNDNNKYSINVCLIIYSITIKCNFMKFHYNQEVIKTNNIK